MKGNRRGDKAVEPCRAALTSHHPRGRRRARSIWFGVSSTNKSKRQWQEALESSNSCFGFSWNNSTYVMRPADNNAQPGTCKNARRMCLHHQRNQWLCFTGTKIEKERKKKEKNPSLWSSSSSWTGFLHEDSCRAGWPWGMQEPITGTIACGSWATQGDWHSPTSPCPPQRGCLRPQRCREGLCAGMLLFLEKPHP